MQTDYSRAILKYLMDYSNMDYPVNIHQIYEHLFMDKNYLIIKRGAN